MEFTAEQIQKLGITDDQLKVLNEEIDLNIAELKKGWDKKANENAQAILDDVAKGIEEKTGIKREQGMKHKDYLDLASNAYLKGQKESLERKERELDEKIKNGSDELTKKELDQAKKDLENIRIDLDKFKDKAAKYDEYEAADYKGKYEQANQELTGLRLNTAFNNVKPTFPATVNVYEAKAKWDEFVKGVQDKNNIELDKDGVAWAVDKENEHKRVKLESLVEKDKAIQELSKGRQATGFGKDGKKGEDVSVEGLPFKIESTASAAEVQNKIREYIAKELNLPISSKEYSQKFSEFYQAYKKAQQTA